MDWNNDGKLDLMAGDASGQVWLFLNEGTPERPKLRAGVNLKAGGKRIQGVAPRYEKGKDGRYALAPNTKDLIGIYSKIHVGDWDGDGLPDLLVGQDGPGGHKLLLYRNTGTSSDPLLAKPVPIDLPGPAMPRPSPYLVDWDGDGQTDLLCGTESSEVYFFRNLGAVGAPRFAEGLRLPLEGPGFERGYRSRIRVTDWNNDGKLDLVVGNVISDRQSIGGNLWLFLGR